MGETDYFVIFIYDDAETLDCNFGRLEAIGDVPPTAIHAAMAMQALLSNADRMKMYEDLASDPLSDNLTRIVARNALRYADALVAETQQGGEKMKKQKENRKVCIRWVDSGMDSGWRDRLLCHLHI